MENDCNAVQPRNSCCAATKLLLVVIVADVIAVLLVVLLPPNMSFIEVALGQLIETAPARFVHLLSKPEQSVALGILSGHTDTRYVLPLNMALYGLAVCPAIKGVVKAPASMISTLLLDVVHFCKNAELQFVSTTLLASHSHTFGSELICVHVAPVRVVSEDGS